MWRLSLGFVTPTSGADASLWISTSCSPDRPVRELRPKTDDTESYRGHISPDEGMSGPRYLSVDEHLIRLA
jgi:hypothetical protein